MSGIINFERDAPSRILRIELIGEVTGEMALREIPAYWRSNPAAADDHLLVDLREDEGALPWSAIGALAASWYDFSEGLDSGQTAFIVRNEAQRNQVLAWMTQFPTRSFSVFDNEGSAREWLAPRLRGIRAA